MKSVIVTASFALSMSIGAAQPMQVRLSSIELGKFTSSQIELFTGTRCSRRKFGVRGVTSTMHNCASSRHWGLFESSDGVVQGYILYERAPGYPQARAHNFHFKNYDLAMKSYLTPQVSTRIDVTKLLGPPMGRHLASVTQLSRRQFASANDAPGQTAETWVYSTLEIRHHRPFWKNLFVYFDSNGRVIDYGYFHEFVNAKKKDLPIVETQADNRIHYISFEVAIGAAARPNSLIHREQAYTESFGLEAMFSDGSNQLLDTGSYHVSAGGDYEYRWYEWLGLKSGYSYDVLLNELSASETIDGDFESISYSGALIKTHSVMLGTVLHWRPTSVPVVTIDLTILLSFTWGKYNPLGALRKANFDLPAEQQIDLSHVPTQISGKGPGLRAGLGPTFRVPYNPIFFGFHLYYSHIRFIVSESIWSDIGQRTRLNEAYLKTFVGYAF